MPELYPDDQKKVDEYLKSDVNRVSREPFKPLVLLGIIMGVLLFLTVASYLIADSQGLV